ncbi:MAG: MFS transporter [Pseudomonadota bacterium]
MRAAFATRAGLLTAAFYAAIFAGLGVHLPFWPVWLADWGLSTAEIGTYLGIALVVRIAFNALVGVIADRYALRRAMMALCGVAAAATFLAHLAAETKALLFLLTLAVTATLSPMVPLGEALGLRAAAMHGFAYAHVRAVGSLAFLLANLGLGWTIGQVGSEAALWAMVISCLAVAGLGAIHPGGGAPPGAGVGGTLGDTAKLGEALALLGDRRLALFALAVALGQGSHATYYLYSALDWGARGISPATVGGLWAIGVVAETALLLGPGRAWVARLSPGLTLALGFGAAALRWGAMMLEPSLAFLWPLQGLHALSFGLTHLAAMAFVAQALPLRLQASGQGLLIGLISGLAMALMTLAAGAVQGPFGMMGAWAVAAGAAGLAALLSLGLMGPPGRPAQA